MIILASIYEVPMTKSLLSSESVKVDTSGLIAVNLYSSGLKKVCLTVFSPFFESFSDKNTIKEPAL
jgi:hypothetical protein